MHHSIKQIYMIIKESEANVLKKDGNKSIGNIIKILVLNPECMSQSETRKGNLQDVGRLSEIKKQKQNKRQMSF